MPTILLLGTRGIPAAHGGFETFVEHLAPYLAERNWTVYVYCQEIGDRATWEDTYRGVTLIHVSVPGKGTASTILFDWISMRDALRRQGLLFSFGYPTGLFAIMPWIKRRHHIINMDGIEWKRSQHGTVGRIALYINERFAAKFGSHLIADHPVIADHLASRASASKITMIAYGAEPITDADTALIQPYGLETNRYAIIIARPEPDNSILELVTAFSSKHRGYKLVVLGDFSTENNYQKAVKAAASKEIVFLGAIYKKSILHALRKSARFYAHGHRVGGTNPSLVEALGAGSAVLAHDNEFNRWVADDSALYFSNQEEISDAIERLFRDETLVEKLRKSAKKRFEASFTWSKILEEYESLLEKDLVSSSPKYSN